MMPPSNPHTASHRLPLRRLTLALAVLLAAGVPAVAQTTAEPAAGAQAPTPGAFGGFGGDNKQPIQIESRELEVKDTDGIAIFTGDVVAKQGDSTLETEKMIVHYAGSATSPTGAKKAPAAAPAGAAPGGVQNQQIEKLEAIGNVLLTSKDQSASGQRGLYDSKAQTFVMTGNVVLTQGKNVVRGDKLTVDLTTNNAHVTSNKRVQMLLVPGQGQDGAAAPAAGKPKTQ